MPASRAHIQATTRYESKAYDKITLRLRKDGDLTRETIARAADQAGESVNAYIMQAILDRMQIDNFWGRESD